MTYLVEFHAITKILLTLRKITKKITKNFQLPKKSEKSPNLVTLRKSLAFCSKSANKLSASCLRTACPKLSISLEQAVNNL
jgi:hypothetical protein